MDHPKPKAAMPMPNTYRRAVGPLPLLSTMFGLTLAAARELEGLRTGARVVDAVDMGLVDYLPYFPKAGARTDEFPVLLLSSPPPLDEDRTYRFHLEGGPAEWLEGYMSREPPPPKRKIKLPKGDDPRVVAAQQAAMSVAPHETRAQRRERKRSA